MGKKHKYHQTTTTGELAEYINKFNDREMQVHNDFDDKSELILLYYSRYYWDLIIGAVTIDELLDYIKILEMSEEYEGCAGIQRAINEYINKQYDE